MSADPNESGDFDDFFQSGESGIYDGGPAKLKPEPQPSASEVEDWGEQRPLSPETRARQARLRRLVVAIVVPLGVASTALFATRWLRTPEPEPAPLGVAVGAARTVTLAEPPRAPVVATPEAPKPTVASTEPPSAPVAASAEEPKPVASAEEPKPVASVEAPKPVASAEAPKPVASVEEPKPVASAEAPKPVAASLPKPAPSASTAAVKPAPKRVRSVALAPKEVPKPAPDVARRRSAEVLPTAAFPVE